MNTEGIITKWLLSLLIVKTSESPVSHTLIATNGEMPVIPSVHRDSLHKTTELTKLAEDLGTNGVTVMDPNFVADKVDSLYHHCETMMTSE